MGLLPDDYQHDLRTEFPDFKGLSVRNLNYMRAFAEAFPSFSIPQQLATQAQITDPHHLQLCSNLLHNCPGGTSRSFWIK